MSTMYTFLGTVILFHLARGYADSGMPVFILDADSAVQNLEHDQDPFSKVDSSTFSEILDHCAKNSEVVVIFVERSLSVEDFSRRDKSGHSYPELGKLIQSDKCKYYPSVQDPYKYLTRKFEMTTDNVFDITNTSAYLRIYPNVLKRLYIIFLDGGDEVRSERRASILLRHDRITSDVYAAVREMAQGPVVGFYTAVGPYVSVEKRAEEPVIKSVNPVTVAAHEFGLFYLDHVQLINQGLKSFATGPDKVSQSVWTEGALNAIFKFKDVDLTFSFTFDNQGWSLDEVALSRGGEAQGRTTVYAGADWGYSHACSNPIVVGGGDVSVTLLGYQIQPFRPNDKGDKKRFAAAEVCLVLVTAPIAMGLMVTFLLLAILFYGIMMIMDLKSYDRFDDPHGKPLVIAMQSS